MHPFYQRANQQMEEIEQTRFKAQLSNSAATWILIISVVKSNIRFDQLSPNQQFKCHPPTWSADFNMGFPPSQFRILSVTLSAELLSSVWKSWSITQTWYFNQTKYHVCVILQNETVTKCLELKNTLVLRKLAKKLHILVQNGPNFDNLKSATLEPTYKWLKKRPKMKYHVCVMHSITSVW